MNPIHLIGSVVSRSMAFETEDSTIHGAPSAFLISYRNILQPFHGLFSAKRIEYKRIMLEIFYNPKHL
ncbi:hypothetical protein GCM10008934_33400 [Virgibacillus salarius]